MPNRPFFSFAGNKGPDHYTHAHNLSREFVVRFTINETRKYIDSTEQMTEQAFRIQFAFITDMKFIFVNKLFLYVMFVDKSLAFTNHSCSADVYVENCSKISYSRNLRKESSSNIPSQ